MTSSDDFEPKAADRPRLESRLARARQRLETLTRIVEDQRRRVETTDYAAGLRPFEAHDLLQLYESSQRQFLHNVERISAMIAAIDASAGSDC